MEHEKEEMVINVYATVQLLKVRGTFSFRLKRLHANLMLNISLGVK